MTDATSLASDIVGLDGLYRQHLPAYDEAVVRKLLANALVHRPYTQCGDILLNLHPHRLEIVNLEGSPQWNTVPHHGLI